MSTAMRSEAGQRGNGPSDVRPQSYCAIRSPIRSTGAETEGCRMTSGAGPCGVPFATNIVTPAMLGVNHGAASTGRLAPWILFKLAQHAPATLYGVLAGGSYAD
ncbi:hypothetical protein D3C80_1865490 [compost metagenome]